jgi:hypothetical protein
MANTYSDVTGTYIAGNYAKIPSTDRLGTVGIRDWSFYSVTLSNVHVSYTAANSLFSQAVRGAQRAAELYFVGTPSSNAFVIAIASDTANAQSVTTPGTYTVIDQLKQSIDAFTGGNSTVAALTASGASIA